MRLRLCAAALGLSLFVLGSAGCGGGSSNASNNPADLQGEYLGSFSGTTNGATDTGTQSWKIASDGTLTGTALSTTSLGTGPVTGSVTTGGVVNGSFAYPGGTITVTGTVFLTSARHLTGTLTEVSGATTVGRISIDLVHQ